MSQIIYLIFILPGFFIFTILRGLLRRFGKSADVFDKALYAFLFNIPVFLISLTILNSRFITAQFQKIDIDYSGIKTINDIVLMVSKDIDQLIWLVVIVLLTSIIVGVTAYIIIVFWERVFNKLRGYRIKKFQTVHESCFMDIKESIPIEIYNLKSNTIIAQGFLKEVSRASDYDTEFLLIEQELFKDCMDDEFIKDVESVYVNIDKGYKIITYDKNAMKGFINNKKEEGL